MLTGIPADLLMIYGLGILAVALILWIGRMPSDDFGASDPESGPPSQKGD